MRNRRREFLISGICAGLAAACSQDTVRPAKPANALYWPALPEQPRYVYEAVLRDSDSIRADTRADRMRQLMTGIDPTKSTFAKPLGVAARRGRIYVTDTEGRRVVVFDVPRRRLFTLGHRLDGELRKPAGIAVDRRGAVYVADVTARRVVVYDEFGLYLNAIGGAKELERPTGVAVSSDGTRIYVIDAGGVDTDDQNHRVIEFDKDGQRVRVIGRRGRGPGEFNLPVDGAVAADGTLYVLDAGNFRVQAFAPDGRHLRSFGSVGTGLGQFARPRGIALDPSGNVYVSDANFCNVQVFDPHGSLLIALGTRGKTDEPGRYLLPAGVAVDETRRVYVVDQFFHKIEVLRALSDDEGRQILASAQ